ncbi:MAG: DNA-protecting protein DprA [Clostridia bacterium]|nr:DNA-protecting protein DprA [Clostridia bacterium]
MQYSSRERAYIWLDSFPLSDGEKKKLITQSGDVVKLVKEFSLYAPCVEKISVRKKMLVSLLDNGAYFQSYLKDLEEKGICPIPIGNEFYPQAFERFLDKPLVLYASGDKALLKDKLFSIVGSRRISPASARLGEEISSQISEKFTLLTGVADGGDAAAIEGGLKGSGKVVCFLAGGFSSLPQGNAALLKKVQKKGLIISAHSYDTPTRAFSFGYRNKLLAALSEGVLVLSAGEKSGALITASYASEFEKPLFALPYPPSAATGVGCNALIKKGAHLTENALDVFDYYGVKAAPKKTSVPLTDEEEKVLSLLRQDGELHASEIALKTGVPPYKITAVLSSLEVKGLVVRMGGNSFAPVA